MSSFPPGRGIRPCLPPRAKRTTPARSNQPLSNLRPRLEHMFAKLKDWRRRATRSDRRAHPVFSALCLAAPILFWSNSCGLLLDSTR